MDLMGADTKRVKERFYLSDGENNFTVGLTFHMRHRQLLPTVPPGSNALVQVRVWEVAKGANYEEARLRGGNYGRSELMVIATIARGIVMPDITIVDGFQLQPGRPRVSVGVIELKERRLDNSLVWALRGEMGSPYLIEKSTTSFDWQPMMVLLNSGGSTTFMDPDGTGPNPVFYRARILD